MFSHQLAAVCLVYNSLCKEIKPLEERLVLQRGKAGKACKKEDGFNILEWWQAAAASEKLPNTILILRAVLTNAPNSIPPERLFSVLNDSFDDDQKSAYADYMELCLQLQYNKRTR